jgi:putative selenium metabolism hydrolase
MTNRELAHAIVERARSYEPEMIAFLRRMVAIPSESTHEKPVIDLVASEMRRVGFDEVKIDPLGNVHGRVGSGPRVIAIDAHVDTVGVGDPAAWSHDPYAGKVEGGYVWGRGAGDQEGGMAAMVYAGRIMKDLGLDDRGVSVWFTGTVQEEDCDGMCWQYILKEGVLRPEFVIVTDSTNCRIHRGQRGRMEIGVTVKGASCHASMPHLGDNALSKMARAAIAIEGLAPALADDPFLGKGTIAPTYAEVKTPSVCAVADHAFLHIDRRVTTGETADSALAEVRGALARAGVAADVALLQYDTPSYTGLRYPVPKYFPTWCLAESDPLIETAVAAYETLFARAPEVTRWTFSTNGVGIMGTSGVPCFGFGPAAEEDAHTVNDRCPIEHLSVAAAFYAFLPALWLERRPRA